LPQPACTAHPAGAGGPRAQVQPVLQSPIPNPFNPTTTIAYALPAAGDVTVRIYDPRGTLIKELLHGAQGPGRYQVNWDGTDYRRARVSSGVYFCTVEWGNSIRSRQLILVK
jgi:hypothetical protein